MKLTPRLSEIADLIPPGCRVGDVGSDHGYLVAYLAENALVAKAIASDINQGPVDNAMNTLKENGLEGQIDVRLGGGLEPYAVGEIDVAVIAGMGGMLVRDIISEALTLARSLDFLILQPMTQQSELRRWLVENDFEIFDERNIREGNKYYEIFCVRSGYTEVTDPVQYEIGINKIKDRMRAAQIEEYAAFLAHKIRKYEIITKEIAHKGSEGSAETLRFAQERLEKLKEVLNDVRQW